MTDIIWLKVIKFQWPLLITLGVADEKGGEGRGTEDRVKIIRNFQLECLHSPSLSKKIVM